MTRLFLAGNAGTDYPGCGQIVLSRVSRKPPLTRGLVNRVPYSIGPKDCYEETRETSSILCRYWMLIDVRETFETTMDTEKRRDVVGCKISAYLINCVFVWLCRDHPCLAVRPLRANYAPVSQVQ
jgi:hypothetical protein